MLDEMARRKKRKKKKQKLPAAKNVVRGAFSLPNEYLQQIGRTGGRSRSAPDLIMGGLKNLEGVDAEKFVAWLHEVASQAIQLFPKSPITDVKQLSLALITTPLPLLSRLYWLASYLRRFKEDLERFIGQAQRFEAAMLRGEGANAIAILDEVEETFGYSLWLIDNRIAALQRFKGLEVQKEFARATSKKAHQLLGGVYSFYVSERNEERTVLSRYRQRLQQRMSAWKVKDPIKDAYSFILSSKGWEDFDVAAASNIVGAVSGVSMIDAYSILLNSLEYYSYSCTDRDDQQKLVAVVSQLPVEDDRAAKLAFILGPPSTRKANVSGRIDANQILSRAFANEYASVTSATTLTEELEGYARSSIFRPPGFGRDTDTASKTFANLAHLSTVRGIAAFVRFQGQYDVFAGPSVGTPLVVNTQGHSVLHNLVLPEGDQVTSTTATAAVPPILAAELAMRFAMRKNDYDEALIAYDAVASDKLAIRRLSPLRVRALLALSQFEEAVTAIADACSEDSDLVPMLPMDEMMDVAQRRQYAFADKLSLAVFIDHHTRRGSRSDYMQALQFAYEDAVLSFGEQYPSRLADHARAKAQLPKLVYFLRYIAVPSVMDVSFWLFKTSRATQDERLNVCARLIELDPEHAREYQAEIQEITRAINIEDGVEHVDRSRIFVGMRKLHQWAAQEIDEGFQRYKALVRAGVGFADPGDFERIMKDIAAGQPLPEGLTQYPQDEAAQILVDLYDAIQRQFLHNETFGLDAYLSMRVRHGSLAGHLRGPFEEAGLLANRDRGTGNYQASDSANPLAARADAATERPALDEAIRAFSASFDKLVDNLVKERLQVHRPDKPNGMFVFERSPFIIYFLKANIDEATTLVQFVNLTAGLMDVFLTKSLQNVREYLITEFEHAARAGIDAFKTDADNKLTPELATEVSHRLHAAVTDWQASLARVASWFAPGKEQEVAAMRTMDQIVDIALQATKNAHRNFDPELKRDIADLGLQSSELLFEMTDILFTALDNVHAHSGLGERPKVSIAINAEDVEVRQHSAEVLRRVKVRISNSVDPRCITPANERKVGRIREQIRTGEYRSRVKLEGGTGLPKLQRIVAQDNRQSLEFGYEESDFFVQIDLFVLYKSAEAAVR